MSSPLSDNGVIHSATNDFTINVATVNGSGSASSNLILVKSIFRMGVHVAPKNLFPSNIAGLPTWFLIRVSEKGYSARSGRNEFVIALNAKTVAKDIADVDTGGVLLIDEKLAAGQASMRDDITVFVVPFAKLAKEFGPDPRLRKLLANMVYVGVAAHLLKMDMDVVKAVVADQFASKPKLVNLNLDVVQAGLAYAQENFDADTCQYRIETREMNEGKLLIEGNTATGLGCVMGGCTFVGWYPITPSSSVCEEVISVAGKTRRDADGKMKFAAVQAEDELASLGLVLGAGWAGARSMTATAGPGISLMAEFAGFGYYAEIPAVVVDVQRVGPSTGMPTRTQQGDLSLCRFLSHGDTEHIVLLPTGPVELYEQAQQAFDLAERFQTPVFLLSDLDMGMNYWISETLPYAEGSFDRGKVLDKEALKKVEEFSRYKQVEGEDDGVPYRTLPGTRHPKAPYFTRGSGHTVDAGYTEDPDEYVAVIERIKHKIDNSVSHTPAPVLGGDENASVGIIHYGSTAYAVEEARDALAAEGLATRELRIRSLPLHDSVMKFIEECDVVYVAEQNRDGQMADIIRIKAPQLATKIEKLVYYAGLPMAAQPIIEAVRAGAPELANV
ncbi:MAG: 2-oxoglutarate ferredoxin oxidoreductase subunit alpha [Pseudohongiellaceae bacterium]|jgi:2-oxoglutarate ferredoxin oxidoreductase subunit alpha